MLAANIAGLGFSMEGKHYWMLKIAPLGPRTLLTAKFLTAYIPSLALCEVYILVLQILKGLNPLNLVISMVAVAAIMAGLNGIYLAFGVSGARFDWTNPNEAGRSIGCLGSLAGLIYAPLCFVLFAAPAIAAVLLDLPVWVGQLAGLALGGGAGLAAVFIPLALVEQKVTRLMES
jgi:archaellum biogenesis protein FlaJ (TadC family)